VKNQSLVFYILSGGGAGAQAWPRRCSPAPASSRGGLAWGHDECQRGRGGPRRARVPVGSHGRARLPIPVPHRHRARNIDCIRRNKTFFYLSDMWVPDVIGMVVNMEIYQTLYWISDPRWSCSTAELHVSAALELFSKAGAVPNMPLVSLGFGLATFSLTSFSHGTKRYPSTLSG
jgi:hypothetical protein